jgi:hypothetical protein
MSQKHNNKQPLWASYTTSAVEEQSGDPISWKEPFGWNILTHRKISHWGAFLSTAPAG